MTLANIFTGSSPYSTEGKNLAVFFDKVRILSAQIYFPPAIVAAEGTAGQTNAIQVNLHSGFSDGSTTTTRTEIYPDPVKYSCLKVVWARTDQQYDHATVSGLTFLEWGMPSFNGSNGYELIFDIDFQFYRSLTPPPSVQVVTASARRKPEVVLAVEPSPPPVAVVNPLPPRKKKLHSVSIKRLQMSPGKVLPA
jgi:hypothetical protein